MNFRRISHFIQIAECGSLSKAASRLGIVQPALSQSIRLLEEDLGVTLFTRSRRGMALTDAGRLFLESAYGILNQYNRARENIAAVGADPQGLVSIAMTASALHVLTVPLCDLVRQRHPGIELTLEEGLAGDIHQRFEAGLHDLVISYLVPTGDAVQSEELIEEELFLASRFRPDAPAGDIAFRSLARSSLILPPDQHGMRSMVTDIAAGLGLEIRCAPLTAALHPTMELVEAGIGESLLPWAAIHDRVAAKRLSARRVVRPRLTHRVSMVYPSTRPLTQATRAVMSAIRDAVTRVNHQGQWPGRLLLSTRTAV